MTSLRRLALLLACSLPWFAGAAALAQSVPPAPAHAQPQPPARPASLAAAFERGAAWSVSIFMFVPDEEEPRVGSGFFLDDKGAIATAAHLLGEARQILVALPDRRVVAAQIEGADADADIALLRIAEPPRVHPVFAQPGSVRVGDWVMAVGQPFGLERSVAVGVVSGKDRHFIDDGELMFIQSDVALNPGNSGGPLLDAAGAIIGMNARTIVGPVGTPGASLAIPIDIVLQVTGELRRDRHAPPRPRLGVQFDDVPPLLAWNAGRRDARGALVLAVPAGSLGERLQLRAGDIVTRMNGRAIHASADLVTALLAWRSLADTRIVVERDGHELVLGPQ